MTLPLMAFLGPGRKRKESKGSQRDRNQNINSLSCKPAIVWKQEAKEQLVYVNQGKKNIHKTTELKMSR